MIVRLLTDHHLEFLSLKGGCTCSSESTHVKMPHCRKSHALAQLSFSFEIVSHTLGRGPNESLIKKYRMPSEMKLLERTKVFYCFITKGNISMLTNFKILPKTNNTHVWQYFTGNR